MVWGAQQHYKWSERINMLHSHKQKKNDDVFTFTFLTSSVEKVPISELWFILINFARPATCQRFERRSFCECRSLFGNLLRLWDEESRQARSIKICRPQNVCAMQMLLTFFTFGKIVVVTTQFKQFGAAIFLVLQFVGATFFQWVNTKQHHPSQ